MAMTEGARIRALLDEMAYAVRYASTGTVSTVMVKDWVRRLESLLSREDAPQTPEAHHAACDPGWGPVNYRCHPDCPQKRKAAQEGSPQ